LAPKMFTIEHFPNLRAKSGDIIRVLLREINKSGFLNLSSIAQIPPASAFKIAPLRASRA
jgi:hypothetical protein